jgi:hypothetical protein
MAVDNATLTAEEFEALQEVSKGSTQRVIPAPVRTHLVELGFIYHGTGGLGLTQLGRSRLDQGK